MKTLLPIAIVFVIVAVLAIAIIPRLLKDSGPRGPWPYYIKKPLTQPEQILYHRLIKALPEHIVLAQVQVSRVLGVRKGHSFHEWNNRINRMSYDFVVCKMDSSVIAAIELDDKSHEDGKREATDQKKDKASADAGLRVIRWNVKSLPSEEAIRTAIVTPEPPLRAQPAPAIKSARAA